MESVIEQYLTVVRPGNFEFVEPTKQFADIIIPEGGNNDIALGVLVSFINSIVKS
jgi:uridine kinase